MIPHDFSILKVYHITTFLRSLNSTRYDGNYEVLQLCQDEVILIITFLDLFLNPTFLVGFFHISPLNLKFPNI